MDAMQGKVRQGKARQDKHAWMHALLPSFFLPTPVISVTSVSFVAD